MASNAVGNEETVIEKVEANGEEQPKRIEKKEEEKEGKGEKINFLKTMRLYAFYKGGAAQQDQAARETEKEIAEYLAARGGSSGT